MFQEKIPLVIRETRALGGDAVLLVPGRVADPVHENLAQVWERSIAGIRAALPAAAKLGVRILIQNVWNGFYCVHDGRSDQSADRLAAYIDAIDSFTGWSTAEVRGGDRERIREIAGRVDRALGL